MFYKLPPVLSITAFYCYTSLTIAYKFLFGNLWGMFLTCIVIYHSSNCLLSIEPYNFEQLILWYSEQSESSKSALLGSFITVIGFLIAYATATSNWKSQLLAELKLQAANDIESFFSLATKLTIDSKIYSDSLINAVNQIKNGCSQDDALFLTSYNREQGKLFLHSRQQIVAMGIESHRFQGKYTNLLATSPGVMHALHSAVQCLNSITDKIWFQIPYFIESDQDPVQSFINQVNVSDCADFSKNVELNFSPLNFKSGSIRGTLQASVIPFNFWSWVYIIKSKGLLKDAFDANYKHENRND